MKRAKATSPTVGTPDPKPETPDPAIGAGYGANGDPIARSSTAWPRVSGNSRRPPSRTMGGTTARRKEALMEMGDGRWEMSRPQFTAARAMGFTPLSGPPLRVTVMLISSAAVGPVVIVASPS